MTVSSHSPTDMPERRAASCAVSRACGGMSSTSQGTPDVMPASTVQQREAEAGRLIVNRCSLTSRDGARGPISRAPVFADYGKWTVNISCAGGGIGIFRGQGGGPCRHIPGPVQGVAVAELLARQ